MRRRPGSRRRSWRSRPCSTTTPQMRREPGQFGGPVRHQAGRHHDQRRPVEPAGRFLDGDVGDRLGGLAQPHVVGEQPAQAVLPQMLQPVHALLLVGAQAAGEAGRHRHVRDARATARKRATCAAIAAPSCQRVVTTSSRSSTTGASAAVQHQRVAGAAAARPRSGRPSPRAGAAIRSAGSFRMRPSSRLVTSSPSTTRAAAMPPRSRRRSRIGSSGWRAPSISMPRSSENRPCGASATRMSQCADALRPAAGRSRGRSGCASPAPAAPAAARMTKACQISAASRPRNTNTSRPFAAWPVAMRICTSPSWRMRVRAAASAVRSRRTKTGPPGPSTRTNCRSSSNGMTAPLVVELQQQRVDRLHPAGRRGRAGASAAATGVSGPFDDHLLADRGRLDPPSGWFDAPDPDRGRRGCTGKRTGRRRWRLDADPRHRAGRRIDVPRAGLPHDHARPGWQRHACGGGEHPRLAPARAVARRHASAPARLRPGRAGWRRPGWPPRRSVSRRRRPGPLPPRAPSRWPAGPPRSGAAWSGRSRPTARRRAASRSCRHRAVRRATARTRSVGAPGAGAPANSVEERLLFRPAQRGKMVERRECRRGQMRAAPAHGRCSDGRTPRGGRAGRG